MRHDHSPRSPYSSLPVDGVAHDRFRHGPSQAGAALPAGLPATKNHPVKPEDPFLRLLHALGYTEHDNIVISSNHTGTFRSQHCTGTAQAPRAVQAMSTGDVWFTVNKTIPRVNGRGGASDVIQVVALIADLDFKTQGMGSEEACRKVIDALSAWLGTPPAVVVASGNGLQPYWPISGGQELPYARQSIRRWRVLVERTAESLGGKVDNVFDLARVLRVPGTHNRKDPANPRPVTAEFDPEASLISLDDLDDALNGAGVETPPDVAESLAVYPEASWEQADADCRYVQRMMEGWAADVPDRGRHPWMVGQAVRLTAAVRNGCLTSASHKNALNALAERYGTLCRNGFGGDPREPQPHAVTDAIRWAVQKVEAMTMEQARAQLGNHSHAEATDAPTVGEFRTQPLGERMGSESLAGKYLYVRNIGWHMWDGSRWKDCSEDDLIREAHAFVVNIITEQAAGRASDKTLSSLAGMRHPGALAQLVRAARTVPGVYAEAEDMDVARGLLNCANGTVDLRTGNLRPADPADLITKTTGVNFVPGTAHEDWETALGGLPDAETRDWVKAHYGAAAAGEVSKDAPLVIHVGHGANGKTTVLSGVYSALGDYATQLPDELLEGRHGHPTMWMPLKGARLTYIEEMDEGHVLPVKVLKRLVDTQRIRGRGINQDWIEWDATHTVVINSNYTPKVWETDHGTWRRVAIVPWPFTYVEEPTAPHHRLGLGPRFRERVSEGSSQREAILAWLVAGARTWYANGKRMPPPSSRMAADMEEWRQEADALGRFLTESLDVTGDPDDRVTNEDLRTHFNLQQESEGGMSWSTTLFGKRLRAHRFVTEGYPQVTLDRGQRGRERTGLTGVKWRRDTQSEGW